MVDNQPIPNPEQPEVTPTPEPVENIPAPNVEVPSAEVPVTEPPAPVPAPEGEKPTEVPTVEEVVVPEVVKNPLDDAPKKPKKSGKQFFIGFIAILLGLVGIAYLFILWALVEGNFSDPQFAQFLEMVGMRPVELKEKFTLITHMLFGGISFIFLIATLVKFFQWVMTSGDSIYKKRHAKRLGWFVAILFIFVGIWVGLIWLISNADANPPVSSGKTEELIMTKPLSVVGLTAPITVDFDLEEKLFAKIPNELIKEILWDFDSDGDYDDASGAKVSHRFLDRGGNNGRFPIHVLVRYHSPSINAEREYKESIDVIVSNVEAEAVMDVSTEVGSVPLIVKFSAAESVDVDGQIILYEWDMDADGEYEVRGPDVVEVEKTFYQIGEHVVKLRITGSNNDFSIAEKTISAVAAEDKVQANISSPDSSFEGMVPLSVTFEGDTSYSREGKIIRYEWRVVGEDSSFEGRKMQRVFNIPGEYEVELVVENDAGDRDVVTQIVSVYEKRNVSISSAPVADEDGVLRGKTPFETVLDSADSEIPKAVEWRWDFDSDGIVDDYGRKIEHTFREAGEYKVKLIIVDADDNEFTTMLVVDVEDLGVVAKISALPPSGSVPLTVVLDGSGSLSTDGEIIDYIWEFLDEKPIHYSGKLTREFKQVGVFPVKMTALTSTGARDTTEIFVSVRGQLLQAEISANPMVGTVPLEVKFSPSGSTGNISSYSWNFGDGGISTDGFPSHKFTYPGKFPVKLRITDNRGIVSESSVVVDVKAKSE